ncbi:WxcM-like domain-containing protein [Lysobacter sp. CCNWLW3]|uniref:WxcM-like domain-containing protein n=1 Tax=unclassified Lysobacter TaxID=2635362 RepID=UPI002FD2FE73
MTGKSHDEVRMSAQAQVAADAVLAPGIVLNGACDIGARCVLAAGVVVDSGGSGKVVVESDVRIQAGAILYGPLTVARGALVQAGSVVTRDVPPHAIVAGNPAQIVGYTSSSTQPVALARTPGAVGQVDTSVAGVTLHRLPKVLDLRGNLTVGEFGRSVPFDVKRYFMVFGVPNAEVRGEHAHRICHQFLICAKGSLSVVADDGRTREEFHLDDPSVGLHFPPLIWGIQYKYSADAVLLVFASELYDSNEYIRDYGEFVRLAADARGDR